MFHPRPGCFLSLACALALLGCSTGTTGTSDSAVDAVTPTDSARTDAVSPSDAARTDAATTDTSAPDAAVTDSAAPDADPSLDAAPDAAAADSAPAMDSAAPDASAMDSAVTDSAPLDAPASNPCVAAGNSCVPLVPGACAAPSMSVPLACGPGVGTQCCHRVDAGVVTDSAPPDAPNACLAGGGACVPLGPMGCPAGSVNASLSCGPGLGVQCCVRADAGTSTDAAADAAGPVTCASAGGNCVALRPGSCPAPRVVGDARMYTCGSGLGTECCLPAPASASPVCAFTGTTGEGWYSSTGTLLCHVSCAGLTPMCQRVGTAAAGWYTTSMHGCPPNSQLIVHDDTCM